MKCLYKSYLVLEFAKLVTHHRKLIQVESLRDQQISAAENLIRLLHPWENIIDNPEQQDVQQKLPEYMPSMIAASTILGYRRC